MLVLALLSGCASYELSKEGGMPDGVSVSQTTTDDTAGDAAEPRPAWFAVWAQVEVDENGPKSGVGAVELEIVADDAATSLYTVSLDVSGLEAARDASGDVSDWWTLPVQPEDVPEAILPESIGLGIGILGPDVIARLGAAGLADATEHLYGAYVQVDGGEVATFGYGASEANLDGSLNADIPPPAGVYELSPLYLLALPDQGD